MQGGIIFSLWYFVCCLVSVVEKSFIDTRFAYRYGLLRVAPAFCGSKSKIDFEPQKAG